MSDFFNKADRIKPFFDVAYKLIMVVCKLLLISEILLGAIMVAGRYIFKTQPSWCTELILTCMIYMTMLSASLALRRNAHIRMTAFDKYLPEKVLHFLDFLADVGIFAFAIFMIVDGWKYCSAAKGFFTSLPTVSRFWLYFPIPLAGACILIFQCESLYRQVRAIAMKEENT